MIRQSDQLYLVPSEKTGSFEMEYTPCNCHCCNVVLCSCILCLQITDFYFLHNVSTSPPTSIMLSGIAGYLFGTTDEATQTPQDPEMLTTEADDDWVLVDVTSKLFYN